MIVLSSCVISSQFHYQCVLHLEFHKTAYQRSEKVVEL
jgi:hypothetical protein